MGGVLFYLQQNVVNWETTVVLVEQVSQKCRFDLPQTD